MERLTVAEIEETLRGMGSDLGQAEEHLRFIAQGCSGVYRVSKRQQRQLGHAAALLKLAKEVALEAGK